LIGDVVKAVSLEFEDSAQRKGIALNVKVDAAAAKVRFPKQDLKAILGNLVDNAIKFTQQGAVTVTIRKNMRGLCIIVSDTGCGIEASDQKMLFEKFFKRYPSMPGTGLGLSIVREIVTRYHGSIRIISKGVGAGVRVTITMPIVRQRRGHETNSRG